MGTYIGTVVADLTEGQKAAFYKDDFLSEYEQRHNILKYGDKTDLPTNTGDTVNWFRYHPLDLVTSSTAEDLLTRTGKTLTGMELTASIKMFDNTVEWSEKFEKTHRDKSLESTVAGKLGVNCSDSMAWQVTKTIGEAGVYAIRADFYATAEYDMTGSLDSTFVYFTVDATAWTDFAATATFSADFFNQGYMTVRQGKNYGECRRISDFSTAASCVFTVSSAFEQAALSASNDLMRVHVCQPYGLSSTHALGGGTKSEYINIDALLKAKIIFRRNNAEPFDELSGMFACFLSDAQYFQLTQDSKWETMNTYTPRTGVETGQVGTIANMNLFTTTFPYTETGTTASYTVPTNPVTGPGTTWEMVMCLAKNSFGIIDLATAGSSTAPSLLWKKTGTADSGDKAGVLGFGTWKVYWACRNLNANNAIGICCAIPTF